MFYQFLQKSQLQNMINRPRCRDWSPLTTQQLRLRNLIQITGHNIEADANTSIYFTLHMTVMSAPFFTSERVDSFRNAIWAEINCQSIHKSTSQFVVVRVWQTNRLRNTSSNQMQSSTYLRRTSINNINSRSISDTNNETNIEQRNNNDKDKVLFVWGVYFSGLVPITKRSEVKLKENALIFYIHGGFFTSADYLLAECVPKQCEHFFRLPLPQQNSSNYLSKNLASAAISTKGTINITNTNKNCDNLNTNKQLQHDNDVTIDRIKNDSLLSSSQKSTSIISNSPKRYELTQRSGRLSPSCDVIANFPHKHISNSESNEQNDDEEYTFTDPCILKARYLDKKFFKWEIRRSYNVSKLLLLQEKQRIYRKRTISANEMTEKICMKSAACLNLQLIANKGMVYRPRANPSLGRTLNRLLSPQPEQLKPEDLLKAQELRRKIETAKFRCRFLTMERDRYKVILRKLHDKCSKLCDENIEKESWLMDDYRELSRSRDMAIEQKSRYSIKCEIYDRVRGMLIQRQYQLLGQLREIYIIRERDQNGFFEINGHCLPNTDLLRMYYSSNNTSNTSNAASSLSVAMCYVAHIVLLSSSVLNIPLRLVFDALLFKNPNHLISFFV